MKVMQIWELTWQMCILPVWVLKKLFLKRKHLGVFLRLLARSATGQPITTYSSHFKKPNAQASNCILLLVDNGRQYNWAGKDFRNSLKCIRCAACFNTCPVYRRSGGYSYHTVVAGPIGSILSPNLDMKKMPTCHLRPHFVVVVPMYAR